MLWSWGYGEDWVTRIDAWEPGRLLRLVQEDARPYTRGGQAAPAGRSGAGADRDGVHYRDPPGQDAAPAGALGLRPWRRVGRGGRGDQRRAGRRSCGACGTTSGAIAGGIGRRGGRWSTRRCPGQPRGPGSWAPAASPSRPASPKEGQRYEVVTPDGRRYAGTVQLNLPGQTIAGTVDELDDGWFRLLTWQDARGNSGVWAWLGDLRRGLGSRCANSADRSQEALERLFPERA